MEKMKWVQLMLLSGLILLFSACKSEKVQKETVKSVKIDTVQVYGEKRSVTFPGKVQASSDINLSFRISGPITRIHVKDGEFVKKGQVLAEMDSRDYGIQFSATEAEYKQIKGEAERVIRLYEKGSVAENDYDKAVSGLQQITAKYNAHKNALADTKLTAPFDGYIQKCYFNQDETVAAGMPIFSLISTGSPEIVVNIPASDFIQRDRFETYSAHIDIYPEIVFPLDFVAVNQKANLNQLYSMRLKIRPVKGQPMPSPGISAMVTILFKPEHSEFFAIPVTALFEKDGKSLVWIYHEETQTVQGREVRVKEILTDGTAVIAHGFQVGEKIITAGVHSLSEGEKVKLLPAVSSTNVGGLL